MSSINNQTPSVPLPVAKPPVPPVPATTESVAPPAAPAPEATVPGTIPSYDLYQAPPEAVRIALSPEAAKAEFESIETAVDKVRTPDGAAELAKRAQDLASQVAAGQVGQVGKAFAQDVERLSKTTTRASEAAARIEGLHDQLNGTPQEKAAATAELLAKPLAFGQDIKALKALQGSPLLAEQKKAIDAIGRAASPEALAQQLTADPDLSHYPPGLVTQLGALRQVPNPQLQSALDQVGKTLLDQSAAAREAGAPEEPEFEFFGFEAPAEENPDAPTDPLSAAAVKANPALGQLLAPLQASTDPATQEALKATVQGWTEDALTQSLEANETGSDDPLERSEKTITDFRAELEALATATGLGATFETASQDGVKAVSERLLDDDDIDMEKINANPAYGQLISSLGADEAYKERVDEKVLDLADDMLDDRLDGKEGEDGLKDGIEAFQEDMKTLAEQTGLAMDEDLADRFSKDHEDDFKEVLDEGRNFLQKGLDAVGGVVGKLGFVGDVGNWLGDTAGDVANLGYDTIGKGLGAIGLDTAAEAADMAGDAADFGFGLVGKYAEGLGDGFTGIATGALFLVSHPVQSGKGLFEAVKDPGKLKDALLADAKGDNEGAEAWAHGAGYLVANLIPALFSGGSSAVGSTASAASKFGKFGSLAGKLGGKLDDLGRKLDGKYLNPADELADPKAFARNNADLKLRLKNALTAGESLNVVGAYKALFGKNGKLPESIPAPIRKVLEAYDTIAPNTVITKQLKKVLSDTQIDKLRTALTVNKTLQTALAQEDFQRYVQAQKDQLTQGR